MLEILISPIDLGDKFLVDIDSRVEIGIGGAKNLLIGKLVESFDIGSAHKIYLRDDFLIDDVHDAVNDDEGDESNEEEGESQFAGKRHPLADVGAQLVRHIVHLLHS